MRRLSIFLGVLAAFAVSPTSAWASPIIYDLATGNSAISGFTPPYGTVTVNLTSPTTATITFDSLTNVTGGLTYGYLFGDGGTVGVNVNATSWTLGPVTGSNVGMGFTPGLYHNGGAGNEDGFGSFNQTINTDDGYTHSSTEVSFTLTNTSGTWSDSTNVLIGNADGDIVAAHIFVTLCPGGLTTCDAGGSAITTGFATGNPSNIDQRSIPPIPEPATLVLTGAGLLIAASRVRRGAR